MNICKYLQIPQISWIIRLINIHIYKGESEYIYLTSEHEFHTIHIRTRISYYPCPWISIYIPNNEFSGLTLKGDIVVQ
jgi:hypothetical protein